jgi:hypothetical protein
VNVWGVDFSLKTGVALAWRDRGHVHSLRVGYGGDSPAEQLHHLYRAALAAADVPPRLPTAVYFEQAYSRNERGKRVMYSAEGVLQAAFWEALYGRSRFAPNVWPIRAVEWRRVLGMPTPKEGTDTEKRRERKRQQKMYAIGLGAERGLSEDEFDAVCIMRAGELDIGEAREAA